MMEELKECTCNFCLLMREAEKMDLCTCNSCQYDRLEHVDRASPKEIIAEEAKYWAELRKKAQQKS